VASAQSAAANLQSAKASADAFAAQVKQAQEKLAQANADLRTAKHGAADDAATRARAFSAQANAERKKAELDQLNSICSTPR